ncbi:hypothetical protein GWL_19450 [Herbaspirillum sp. GW103]|nr:hypothetical protein GWL_19450 [Herbaspirillum sp. GW103]
MIRIAHALLSRCCSSRASNCRRIDDRWLRQQVGGGEESGIRETRVSGPVAKGCGGE